MEVPKRYNNGVESTGDGLDGGITTHSRISPKPQDCLFIIGSGFCPNKEMINKYFPILIGRTNKTLYMLLAVIYRYPLRTSTNLCELVAIHRVTINKNVALLIDMGYVQQERKPRKIMMLNSYTVDKVYRITRKGVKALSAITGY